MKPVTDTTTPEVPQIDAEEVKKAIDAKEDFVLIDVRTPEEVSKGRIDGSINIPVDDVAQKVESVVPDKNKTVYVHCLSGTRSAFAVDTMMKMGYSNVHSMTSGMLAWRGKGYPVSV